MFVCLNDLNMCMHIYKQTHTSPHAQSMHTAYHKAHLSTMSCTQVVKDIGTLLRPYLLLPITTSSVEQLHEALLYSFSLVTNSNHA